MSQHVLHTTDADFNKDVLQSELPVLVDFWAPWCGPCRAIAPILDQVAEEYAGKVKIIKMNVDDNPNTPTQFGVRGIPTLMVFKGGERVATKVGGLAKAQLGNFIDEAVA